MTPTSGSGPARIPIGCNGSHLAGRLASRRRGRVLWKVSPASSPANFSRRRRCKKDPLNLQFAFLDVVPYLSGDEKLTRCGPDVLA